MASHDLSLFVGGGLWNAAHHANPNKITTGSSVVQLEFELIVAEVEQLLENENHEKDEQINPLAPCIALARVLIAHVKQWAE